MQPEAQVLVREFNRRLRTALSSAPNHVRVEAALEVESHVMDVLSRHKSTVSEPEQVAEILAGFGTPEEYAKAFMAQLPGVQVVDVHTGAREVTIAAADLVRGMWRLFVALVRRLAAFLLTVLHWLRIGLSWTYSKATWALRAARGPAGRTVAWIGRRFNQLRRGIIVLRLWAGRRLHDMRGLGRVALAVLRWTGRALRWTLRAAVYAGLGAAALAAFGFAIFTAMLPDVVGYWVHGVQAEVDRWAADVRQMTVGGFDQPAIAQFQHTGTNVLFTAVLIGLLMVGLIVFMVWNSRRRRSTVAD